MSEKLSRIDEIPSLPTYNGLLGEEKGRVRTTEEIDVYTIQPKPKDLSEKEPIRLRVVRNPQVRKGA